MRTAIIVFISMYVLISCDNTIRKPYKIQSSYFDSNLIGYWRFDTNEFVSMVIKKDTIYYPDENGSSFYKIYNNSLVIFDDSSFSDTFKYKILGRDTLLLYVFDRTQTYIKQVE